MTDQTIYGGTNTYAGISFEFAECITIAKMNNNLTNENGWGACELRGTLNSITYNSLENKTYIKAVNKKYIATHNNAGSVTMVADKIWLLSCSEIWNNGKDGQPYGMSVAKEGEQYKYYKNINAIASIENSSLVKKNNNSNNFWWLRSPSYGGTYYFCGVSSQGSCNIGSANDEDGVVVGFDI